MKVSTYRFWLCVLCLLGNALSFGDAAKIQWIPSGQFLPTLNRLLDSVDGSTRQIDFLHYNFFSRSGASQRLRDRLIELKAKYPQLYIRVLLDEPGENVRDSRLNWNTVTSLKEKGIFASLVAKPPKEQALNQRWNHGKIARIDNKLLLGSTTLTNSSLRGMNEFDALIESDLLSLVVEQYIRSQLSVYRARMEPEYTHGPVSLLFGSSFLDRSLEILAQAKAGEKITIATSFFESDEPGRPESVRVISALQEAVRRGVHVRIYLEQNDPDAKKRANNIAVSAIPGIGEVYLNPLGASSHLNLFAYEGEREPLVIRGFTHHSRDRFLLNHPFTFLVSGEDSVRPVLRYLDSVLAYQAVRFEGSEEISRPLLFISTDPVEDAAMRGRGLTLHIPAKPLAARETMPRHVALLAFLGESFFRAHRSQLQAGVVAQPYLGSLEIAEGGEAQCYTYGKIVDWHSGSVLVNFFQRDEGATLQNFNGAVQRYVERVQGEGSGVFLVSSNYWIEYRHCESPSAAGEVRETIQATSFRGMILQSSLMAAQVPETRLLTSGEAFHRNLDPALLAETELMEPCLAALNGN